MEGKKRLTATKAAIAKFAVYEELFIFYTKHLP